MVAQQCRQGPQVPSLILSWSNRKCISRTVSHSQSINSKSKQYELAPVTQTGEDGPGGAQGSEVGGSLVMACSEHSLLLLCSTGSGSSPYHNLFPISSLIFSIVIVARTLDHESPTYHHNILLYTVNESDFRFRFQKKRGGSNRPDWISFHFSVR